MQATLLSVWEWLFSFIRLLGISLNLHYGLDDRYITVELTFANVRNIFLINGYALNQNDPQWLSLFF